jgi:RND family efflux transporter MFP subunit
MFTRNKLELCAALVSCAVLPGCSRPAAAVEKKPIPVRVHTVEQRTAGAPTRYSGYLEAAVRVDAAFRVGGYVESLYEVNSPDGKHVFDKGDFVKKGTVLARVRVADYAERVASARAQVTEATAHATLADAELARAQNLFASKAITRAELDTKEARSDASHAEVAAARAREGEAGLSLGDTVLRAPMDGVVLTRYVEVGSLVAPGQPALVIADTRTVKAVFGAPQSLVERLSVGTKVRVFVGAEAESRAPEKLLEAQVTRIAPAADSNGRVFSVEAALPNENGTLRPGAVVSVHVPDGSAGGLEAVVPLSSVLRSPTDPRGFSVFVLEGNADKSKALLRDVRLGEVIGNAVTIEQGLALGQRVVTVGATLLHDGAEAVVIR